MIFFLNNNGPNPSTDTLQSTAADKTPNGFRTDFFWSIINPFGAGIFFILAHPVYKMWIIQEPDKLELWNKLHSEEKKTENIYHV